MTMLDKSKFESYLTRKMEANDLCINDIWKNLEGWSMETYSLGLSYTRGGQKVDQNIIVRKVPDAGLMDDNYDVSIEYRVLSALGQTDVAVPKTFWMEEDPEVLGQPFYVMEKVEGEIPFPPALSLNPKFRLFPDDEERLSVADDFVKNLASIHNADWRSLGLDFLGDPGLGTGSAIKQIEYWEDRIERAGFSHKPTIAYALAWLRDNLVENENPCLIHGDYRSGNFITADNRIVAILDWELVSLGDPMFDIAYILGAWRSAPPLRWLSHLLPEEEFFERYEQASGIKIDHHKLQFYRMLFKLKAVGITSTAAGSFRDQPKLDLKIGVFSMSQYFAYFDLINEFSKQHSSAKGA